jgi:hypothetical protein
MHGKIIWALLCVSLTRGRTVGRCNRRVPLDDANGAAEQSWRITEVILFSASDLESHHRRF